MSAALRIELPAPHAAQRQVLSAARRFNVLACGRRWGKSQLGVDRIVKAALEGFPCAWFSPTYKMLLEAWRALQDVLAPVIEGRSNAEMRLSLRGGGSITAFSLDAEIADVVRGRAFKLAIVDEAALVRNFRQTWEAAIRPTLADHRGGAWFLSTPRGFNDFKFFFDRGADPELSDWARWQMPTAANPFIDRAEIEAARADMTEAAFAQEFEAQFVSWEGAVFRRVQECSTAERKDAPEDGHEYVIGVDWGRSNDFTVFCVLDVTARRLVDLDRSNRVDYAVQRGRLQALYERWRPSRIIAEANSIGQPIIEQLFRDGLPVQPFTTTNASKAAIIEALALAFEQGTIAILPDPVLLGELQAFQAEQLPSGLIRYSAPTGQHDDTVLGLALAWSVMQPAARGVYASVLTPDSFYDDVSRPIGLLSPGGHRAHWVTIHIGIGAPIVFADFYDDGRTIWLEHEFYSDPRVSGIKGDAGLIDDLIGGSGDWPGFGIEPRLWPGVIVDPEAATFAAQLRRRGAWTIEAQDAGDESVRQVLAFIAAKRLRIHQRCVNIRRDLTTRTWDDFAGVAGKRFPDPLRMIVATKGFGKWRLSN